jgi:glycosyltransferase involved in cell wall biosynthesis
MVSEAPLLSILVPTRNRPGLAEACVRAVLAQRGAPPFELILADQSDGGETRDVALAAASGDSRFRHVAVDGRGRSRALNAAIPRARGNWVVMTDDDCVPSPSWLQELARAVAAAPERSIVVGRVIPGPAAPGRGEPPAILDLPAPRTIAGHVDRDWIYPNVAVPRALFDEIGVFDERLGVGTPIPGGEDNDLGYRLLRAGWTIVYRPEPVVEHAAWRSVAERAALKRAYGIGQGGFYAKHVARGDLFVLWRAVKDLARASRASAGSVLRGRGADARGHLAYAGGLFAGAARMGRHLASGRDAGGGR